MQITAIDTIQLARVQQPRLRSTPTRVCTGPVQLVANLHLALIGMLLAAIAIEMMAGGLAELLPQLHQS